MHDHNLTDWTRQFNAGPPAYLPVQFRELRYCTVKGCDYYESRVDNKAVGRHDRRVSIILMVVTFWLILATVL